MYFVSEEDNRHELTCSATSAAVNNHPFAKSTRGSRASKPRGSEN